jgi:hypothetical protein
VPQVVEAKALHAGRPGGRLPHLEPEAPSGVYKRTCHIVGGQQRATSEAEEVAWLTPAEVRERMDEAYATRLPDALDPGEVAIRAHDGLSLLPAPRL